MIINISPYFLFLSFHLVLIVIDTWIIAYKRTIYCFILMKTESSILNVLQNSPIFLFDHVNSVELINRHIIIAELQSIAFSEILMHYIIVLRSESQIDYALSIMLYVPFHNSVQSSIIVLDLNRPFETERWFPSKCHIRSQTIFLFLDLIIIWKTDGWFITLLLFSILSLRLHL